MMFQGIEVRPQDITCVIPWNRRVLLKPFKMYAELATNLNCSSIRYHICVDDVEDTDMSRFKFEHIKYIKTLPNPDDRVADFEIRDKNGLPDFDKERRLIESRKTREERQAEIKEDMYWIDQFEKAGLDCEFLKEELKRKIQGRY